MDLRGDSNTVEFSKCDRYYAGRPHTLGSPRGQIRLWWFALRSTPGSRSLYRFPA